MGSRVSTERDHANTQATLGIKTHAKPHCLISWMESLIDAALHPAPFLLLPLLQAQPFIVMREPHRDVNLPGTSTALPSSPQRLLGFYEKSVMMTVDHQHIFKISFFGALLACIILLAAS